MVLVKTFESSLDRRESKPVNPKGNKPWIFIRRVDDKAEAPIFWPSVVKNWPIGKDPDVGKDWKQKKRSAEDDSYIASLTQGTWNWAHPRREWRTGNPGVLQSMGLQRDGQDLSTE